MTPYEITARSEPSAPKCFVHLFVDGQKVDQHFLAPGTAVNFKGIPAEGGALKELLFSLPRFVTRAEKLRGMSGGTVCALDGEALSEVRNCEFHAFLGNLATAFKASWQTQGLIS